MKRGGWLKRKTPLRAVSPHRRAYEAELDRVTPSLLKRAEGRCELTEYAGCFYNLPISLTEVEAGTVPVCGGPPHRHHILRRAQGGTNDLSNLLYVCRNHHDFIHSRPRLARERGWLMRSAGVA